jgi:hypothetical protein
MVKQRFGCHGLHGVSVLTGSRPDQLNRLP